MGQEPQMQGRGRLWGLRRLLSASRRTGRRVLDSLLLKAVLAFMVFVASPTMLVSSIKRAGLDVPAITRTVQAQASPWKRFSSRTLEEKLAGVPAFMVVNSQGQPYLTPVGPSEQAGLFFTNLEDAKQMLSEMVQIPNYQKDARIYVVPLEKVFTMIEKGPTETGSVRSGQRETMTFLMYPDNRAMEEYYEQAQIKTKPPGVVPVFSVEGLLIEKDGCKVKPLFFDLADLNKAYRDMRRKNKKISYRPKITMYSLPEVLVQMREDEKGNFKDYGFVPSSKSMEFLAEAKKQKGHRSRLARMSRF